MTKQRYEELMHKISLAYIEQGLKLEDESLPKSLTENIDKKAEKIYHAVRANKRLRYMKKFKNVVAVLIVCCTVLMSASIFEAGAHNVQNFIVKSTGHGTAIKNEKSEYNTYTPKEIIESVYIPTIPSEYTLSYSDECEFYFEQGYHNETGDELYYCQRLMSIKHYTDASDEQIDEFEHRGTSYIYYFSSGKAHLEWNDFGYAFCLESYELGKDELIGIAESIKEDAKGEVKK